MTDQSKTLVLDNGYHEQEEHWVAVSDLMSGLMMVFLLLAVLFMMKVELESKKIKDVAVLYDKLQRQLYTDLYEEFKNDLPRWNAELTKDLSIRFKEPDILFATGKAVLKPKFKNILDNFFPRYVAIITSDKYRNDIVEIRIEGHTSSFWNQLATKDEAYTKNMALSQKRTRTTLFYVLGLSKVTEHKLWLRRYVTANGLSSSQPIVNPDGTENFQRSQRVEFRIRTNAEKRIVTILEQSQT